MSFPDDEHGWAVGDLGTILASGDGGRTWQPQRDGGTRAALLGIFADLDNVPLELIASLAGNEGYLTSINVLGRRDVEMPSRDDVHPADRLHEAVVRVGGCGADVAWQFPCAKLVSAWGRGKSSPPGTASTTAAAWKSCRPTLSVRSGSGGRR